MTDTAQKEVVAYKLMHSIVSDAPPIPEVLLIASEQEKLGILTPKEEKFARLIVDGKTQAEAYQGAYNSHSLKSAQIEGSKVFNRPRVYNRILDLQKEASIYAMITPQRVIVETWDIVQKAKGGKQYKAAVDGMQLIAKSMGMLTEQVSIEHRITVDELATRAEQLELEEGYTEGEFAELVEEATETLPPPQELNIKAEAREVEKASARPKKKKAGKRD